MSFLWPWLLWLLLLVPLLILAYIWILRRKRRFAVRYSSLSLIRDALPKHSRWRRHLPFGLFVLALACLATAVARPVAAVTVPRNRTTVVLAVDVSRSMCATDVAPNRLAVAQDAALAFVRDQAGEVRIGMVAFASLAEIVVPPSNDKQALQKAIENLTTSVGTAIGSATLKAIDAIAELNEAVAPSGVHLGSEAGERPQDGFYQPDIIVVLTDGANTRGPLPLDAAQKAADRQVRIYTIGFGSANPGQMVCSPAQLGGDALGRQFGGGGFGFGGGGFGSDEFGDGRFGGGGRGLGGGFRNFLLLDEDTLQEMADLTGGAYYRAEDAEQLYDVFADLPTEIVLTREQVEVSAILAVLGAALATLAGLLALIWHRFP